MNPIEVMVDDLGRQIAQKAIECAEWRARALIAEAAIEEIRQASEGLVEDAE